MKILSSSMLLVIALFATGAARAADDNCAPKGDLQFVCGPKNAEDLVAVPNTKWLLSSGMADGGGVMLIDARDGKWRVAYPGSSPRVAHDAKYAACATAPGSSSNADFKPRFQEARDRTCTSNASEGRSHGCS